MDKPCYCSPDGSCSNCVKEIEAQRDALAAEVQKLKAEVEQWKAENESNIWLCRHRKDQIDHLRSLAQGMAEALKEIRKLQGLGNADEDIPDDKELAYQLGSTDTLMDTYRISDKALTAWDAFEKGQSCGRQMTAQEIRESEITFGGETAKEGGK